MRIAVLVLATACAHAPPRGELEGPPAPPLARSTESAPRGTATIAYLTDLSEPGTGVLEGDGAPPRYVGETIQACYDAALRKEPELGGWLLFDFPAQDVGDEEYVPVQPHWGGAETSENLPSALVDCVTRAVRTLQFPEESLGIELDLYLYVSLSPNR